ncbi:MAG: F0F1 ATP synthase subunit A [Candidatus Latescibacter sp.]|nr:F0F1 ATP synthase subunit A [Candidatus Latescibacter sp.]
MEISPDSLIFWSRGPITLNATLLFTWIVMALIVVVSWLSTRNLTGETIPSRWQTFLEAIVSIIEDQIRDVTRQAPGRYLPFLGTLFLFISISNLLSVVPGYHPPTGSISTTGALAVCVFFAVPIFGISGRGLRGYLKHYIKPTVFMAPFHIIGEFSRTLALAVRLFGNVMSGTIIGGVLILFVPLFLPIVMQVFELLIGQIQAFIFTVLAAVYIASGTQASGE